MTDVAAQLAEPGRVLVVDDDASMRASVEALLALQFQVTSAANLNDAAVALGQAEFDVVLTDYEMPGGSGIDLMRLIRERFPNVLVICVTGYPDQPELRQSEAQHALLRVISKPYDPKRLLGWVDNAIRLSRLQRATNRLTQKRGAKKGSG